MIFVCVGSREYPFDRLIKEVDDLVEKNIISNVFAQIGTSNYIPQNFQFKRFLSSDEFQAYQNEAQLIISHGGTGALIGALKKNKQTIAVPRLEKYNEHTDDHQIQVSNVLEEMGYLKLVTDINNLGTIINELIEHPIKKKYNRPSKILSVIDSFITESLD